MLLVVLILSSTILAATTIAGLLMLYQIRQSGDITNSTKAIYAADTGLEQQIYNLLMTGACGSNTALTLGNGAAYGASCRLTESTPPQGCGDAGIVGSETVLIQSVGDSRKNYRAFEAELSRSIPPPPCPPPPPAP